MKTLSFSHLFWFSGPPLQQVHGRILRIADNKNDIVKYDWTQIYQIADLLPYVPEDAPSQPSIPQYLSVILVLSRDVHDCILLSRLNNMQSCVVI